MATAGKLRKAVLYAFIGVNASNFVSNAVFFPDVLAHEGGVSGIFKDVSSMRGASRLVLSMPAAAAGMAWVREQERQTDQDLGPFGLMGAYPQGTAIDYTPNTFIARAAIGATAAVAGKHSKAVPAVTAAGIVLDITAGLPGAMAGSAVGAATRRLLEP